MREKLPTLRVCVTTLATVTAQLGLVALQCIQEVRNWFNTKRVDQITKDLNSKISQVEGMGRSIHSYRLMNLHVTQIIDDAQDLPSRVLHLKELNIVTPKICEFIAQDLGRISRYFDQNLGNFPTDHQKLTQNINKNSYMQQIFMFRQRKAFDQVM